MGGREVSEVMVVDFDLEWIDFEFGNDFRSQGFKETRAMYMRNRMSRHVIYVRLPRLAKRSEAERGRTISINSPGVVPCLTHGLSHDATPDRLRLRIFFPLFSFLRQATILDSIQSLPSFSSP
jgi:hypothetical protein